MTDENPTPGWATYLRVSDEDKQSPENSFAMQRQFIREQLLINSDIPFYREYTDILTGTTANRADYQEMLADAEARRFSHLGIYRADRFGRDKVEGIVAASRLIKLGIKIRNAHMPFLQPETPDGWFIFGLQMGVAQHEVDVMRKRANDGRKAKMLAGCWAAKAPEGYVNKERLIRSGKYERWVEQDPEIAPGLRKAWELLLTDRYTLDQICEELTALGFTRPGGRPWAWTDPKTGDRRTAKNRLSDIFHKPFYAGWNVSKTFNIPYRKVRGQWKPIVTSEEFERGVEILRHHDSQKSRTKRHFYLLRTLLWVDVNGRLYKMYVSTPTGRSRSYSYYLTHSKPSGRQLRFSCASIDTQIQAWLRGITVDPEMLPSMRETYQRELAAITQTDYETRAAELKRRISQIRQEEARLGRLLITGRITEETYDLLRVEWMEKLRHAQANLTSLERDMADHLDELDLALILLTRLSDLYTRLEEKQQATLLQIIAKRIIVSADGEIFGHELHSPFEYLTGLVEDLRAEGSIGTGSAQVRPTPLQANRPPTIVGERFFGFVSIRTLQRPAPMEAGRRASSVQHHWRPVEEKSATRVPVLPSPRR